jgi:anion-transporting  ArsA/GET3 family ATPase
MKVVSAGFLTFTRLFTKIIGAQTLQDVGQFVAALETMFGGFRQRAEETYRLLAAPGTAFVVVSAPEPAALREASYFVDRLITDKMPLAGLVLNRVVRSTAPELPAERALAAAEELEAAGTDPLTVAVLRVHAERVAVAQRQDRVAERFSRAHPDVPRAEITALAGDVHDLEGLRVVAKELAEGPTDWRDVS